MGASAAYYTTREKAIQYLIGKIMQASNDELEEMLRIYVDTDITSPYIKDDMGEYDDELNLD